MNNHANNFRSLLSNSNRNPMNKDSDCYFSVDIETDGPIPGVYSILSFAIVYSGTFDGNTFESPEDFENYIYFELKPISEDFEPAALKINGLDRDRLRVTGLDPSVAMDQAYDWITRISDGRNPVLVAYPLSFDWSWLYWYFIRFARNGSPFDHSRCFDVKTAYSVKAGVPISKSGKSRLPSNLISKRPHTHHALDDAKEQAEIFTRIFKWAGKET